MCGPTLAWNLFVIDMAYVLVLVGGAMVLRARNSMPFVWLAFGTLAASVGAFLFFETWLVQTAVAASSQDAIDTLKGGC